ncbi:alpha/beta hydrolase [Nocardiopsis kunsanensis]|uniref:Proteinase n=1 Tax=Nocardiopsis kunsanensis TaxID=141693 RepID=A0A919CIU2_9ACTN|nr:alpha/beta hydrolase [Nocardiopsis kunsanensis]GHD28109.1 proteinase [Nocardiopsis kunsanensis]
MAGLVAVAVLAVSGCTGQEAEGPVQEEPAPSEAAPEAFTDQGLDWSACEEGTSGTECATFEVPLDYGEPGGERIEIAVKRFPSESGDPVGSLVVNPGGPGGSGFDFADAAPFITSGEVRSNFDVVGFDPRGVGRSTPLTCMGTEEIDEYLGAGYDTEDGTGDAADLTEEGVAELEENSRDFVAACQEQAPELMMHVGTENVARDMDVLRVLLGDDRLTYMGASYGTHIGAQYAEQFPDRVRALVLDGAVDPSQTPLEAGVAQATGFETALRAFVEDCLGREDCPLGGPGDEVEDGVQALAGFLEDTARRPLDHAGDDREVNRARAELGMAAALYSEDLWERVRAGITAGMEEGDGTVLMQLADDLYSRGDPAAYENSTAMLSAVNCSDAPGPRDVDAYEEAAQAAGEQSPLFGPGLAWGALTCAFWPEEAVSEGGELTAEGADPIMVLGTTRDSATPYAWSEALAEQLDPGFLLTRDGDGHTGYRMGDPCIDGIVDDYLIDLTVPEDGMVCA